MTFKQLTIVKDLVIERLDLLEANLANCRKQRKDIQEEEGSEWAEIPKSLQDQIDFLKKEISTYAEIIDAIDETNCY